MKPESWLGVAQIAVTLVGIVLAPYLAVRLSLKRFRSEKWWELQTQTYYRTLENLAIIKHSIERTLENLLHPDYADAPSKILQEQVPLASAELAKIAATGPCYISKAASDALDTFIAIWNIDFGGGPESDYDQYLEAAKKCMEVVRREAVLHSAR